MVGASFCYDCLADLADTTTLAAGSGGVMFRLSLAIFLRLELVVRCQLRSIHHIMLIYTV